MITVLNIWGILRIYYGVQNSLVDDEVNLIDPMAYSLKETGFDVCTAYNGNEALGMYESEEPDIILLDWSMPDLSGIDVLKKIREAQNFVPVIMVTGKSAKEEIVEGLEHGADDYVTKPFNWDELVARVNSALEDHSKHLLLSLSVLDLEI